MMAPFVFRCPNTSLDVQGWAPDDESKMADDVFVGVPCPACGWWHFVNSKTGKRVGENGE